MRVRDRETDKERMKERESEPIERGTKGTKHCGRYME